MSLGVASEHIELSQQRERETELIFVGQQYQNAIGSYYQQSPNGLKEYPTKLSDLIEDKRSLSARHHLRKQYADPMTGSQEWGLVRNSLGQITGVYSLSPLKPITSREDLPFAKPESESAAAVMRYSDWKFIYIPAKDSNSNATDNANATPLSGNEDTFKADGL